MGKITNGIFGGVSGKIGNIIGYELNKQKVIRTIGINNKPPTAKQLNNRQQMKVIMVFFSPIENLIRTGFNPKAKNTTKNFHNLAISCNKPYALIGFYPNVEIDFSKIVFSKGNLPQPINAEAKLIDNHIEFTWDATKSKDQVMLLVYSPESKLSCYTNSGARKSAGKELLELKHNMRNEQLEVYISFVSDDREDVADSLYLGSINI